MHRSSASLLFSPKKTQPSPKIMKSIIALCPMILFGSFLASSKAFAQVPENAQPITQEQLAAQTTIASLTSCALSANKKYSSILSVMDSIAVTTSPVVGYIVQVHGGAIKGVNNEKKLTPEQIQQGLFFQTVGMVKSRCFDKLTSNDKKLVEKVIDDAKKQLK